MQNFDFNKALKAIQLGKPITGSDGVLAPLIKQLTEAALSAEIDSYLEQNPTGKRRNGYSKKTVKSAFGSFELETPRDRNGEFEPEQCFAISLLRRELPAIGTDRLTQSWCTRHSHCLPCE